MQYVRRLVQCELAKMVLPGGSRTALSADEKHSPMSVEVKSRFELGGIREGISQLDYKVVSWCYSRRSRCTLFASQFRWKMMSEVLLFVLTITMKLR